MTRKVFLNRREFLESASIVAAGIAACPDSLLASAPLQSRLAIVGSMGDASQLRLYSVRRNDWKLLQKLQTKAPVSMLLHPNHDTLYVLNQVDAHEGLPRGTVETYRLNRGSGKLAFLSRQPLSLSAINPRHMALSPDGTSLAVAVASGGAYNLLPILEDGQLGRVSSQRKEIGSGPVAGRQDSSHPQSVIFLPGTSTMLASDLGSDRLSVFSTEEGIELGTRVPLPPGSGPRNLALHPGGKLLFVDHALEGALSIFELNLERNGPNGSTLRSTLTSLPDRKTCGAFGDALAMHRSGELLYTAGRGTITAWQIHTPGSSSSAKSNGRLLALQSIAVGPVRALVFDPEGSALYASTPYEVLQFETEPISGRLGNPRCVASIPDAHSILFV